MEEIENDVFFLFFFFILHTYIFLLLCDKKRMILSDSGKL
jgi:hypothetical protein